MQSIILIIMVIGTIGLLVWSATDRKDTIHCMLDRGGTQVDFNIRVLRGLRHGEIRNLTIERAITRFHAAQNDVVYFNCNGGRHHATIGHAIMNHYKEVNL